MQPRKYSHRDVNKARKTLKDGKKKVGCLGSLGLEEQQSGEFPGFPYCLQYNPSRVPQKPPSQNHQQAQTKVFKLYPLAEELGKGWFNNRKCVWHYPPYSSQMPTKKYDPFPTVHYTPQPPLYGSRYCASIPHWLIPAGQGRDLFFHCLLRRSRWQHSSCPTRWYCQAHWAAGFPSPTHITMQYSDSPTRLVSLGSIDELSLHPYLALMRLN